MRILTVLFCENFFELEDRRVEGVAPMAFEDIGDGLAIGVSEELRPGSSRTHQYIQGSYIQDVLTQNQV